MFRCPNCKEISVPKSAAFTLLGNVDCKSCLAKLRRKRFTFKQVLLTMFPITAIVILYFAMQRVIGNPPAVPGWTFPQFLFWVAVATMFITIYINVDFETIDQKE